MSPSRLLLLSALAFLVAPSAVLASPSGLNNIPTTDVAPIRVAVVQAWSNSASAGDTTYVAGVKSGLTPDLEVGLDSRLSPDGGPLTSQFKYRLRSRPGAPALLAVGLANLSTDRSRAGQPMPYVVATSALAPATRAHLGYSAQKRASGLFLGADWSVSPVLLLRSDWVRPAADSGDVSSLGTLFTPAGQPFAVEAWASFPGSPPSDTTFTLKLDWALPY